MKSVLWQICMGCTRSRRFRRSAIFERTQLKQSTPSWTNCCDVYLFALRTTPNRVATEQWYSQQIKLIKWCNQRLAFTPRLTAWLTLIPVDRWLQTCLRRKYRIFDMIIGKLSDRVYRAFGAEIMNWARMSVLNSFVTLPSICFIACCGQPPLSIGQVACVALRAFAWLTAYVALPPFRTHSIPEESRAWQFRMKCGTNNGFKDPKALFSPAFLKVR